LRDETTRLLTIVLEPDPRVGEEAEIRDAEDDRKARAAADALVGIRLGGEPGPTARAGEA
jgi:hypothetical protein